MKQLLILFATSIIFNACAQQSNITLKSAFKNDFFIGVAIGKTHFQEKNKTANTLINSQFNSLTAENAMKSEEVHPEMGKYNFDEVDKFIAYGQKNNMYLVGHTLVWHSQLSPFVNKMKSVDSINNFLTDHITTIVNRYAGKIKCWDVVNEALNEDGTLRQTIFYKNLGENYIINAFKLAQKADSKAELYYNDYNIEQPQKRKGAIELIKKIQQSGGRIDGVGIQGHWSIESDNLNDIEESLIEFSKLGIKVAFTELDLTVIPNPWDLKGAEVSQNFPNSPFMNPYPKQLPDAVNIKLAKKYEALFKLFLKHKDKISRITFWGVNDGHSWLNGWPIKDRTNYPLLFDRAFKPKLAFEKVISLKK